MAEEVERRRLPSASALLQRLSDTASAAAASPSPAALSAAAAGVQAALLQYLNQRREAEQQQQGTAATSLRQPFNSRFFSWLQFAAVGLQTLTAQADALSAASSSSSSPPRLPVRRHALLPLIRFVAADVRALAVEKFGASPELQLVLVDARGRHVARSGAEAGAREEGNGDGEGLAPSFVGVAHHFEFVLAELLKNSYRAVAERYPAAVEDAPPVRIIVSARGRDVFVRVSDAGGGMPTGLQGETFSEFPYFHTTTTLRPGTQHEPTYHYSRDFGSAIAGYGVGLARSAVYARAMGGALCGMSQPGLGVDMLLRIDSSGETAMDWAPPPPPATA